MEWVVAVLRARIPELVGCDRAAIEALEDELGQVLPASYTAFLEAAGVRAGSFMAGSDIELGRLVPLQARFRSQTRDVPELASNAFAFLGHHDSQYLWFLVGEGDDPIVFYWNEAQPTVAQFTGKTFSQGLVELVRDELAAEAPDDLQ
jgi:hypothetical protein